MNSGVIVDQSSVQNQNHDRVELTAAQRRTILAEAGEIYDRALALTKSDSAESNDLFTTAAEKYQLLVDSGIHNSRLYLNLGNAYLQSNRLGKAIANYERANCLIHLTVS